MVRPPVKPPHQNSRTLPTAGHPAALKPVSSPNAQDQIHTRVSGLVGGRAFINVWNVNEALELNASYQVPKFAPGFFLVGTDGGGEGIAMVRRGESVELGFLPLVGMSPKRFVPMGGSFVEFLRAHIEEDEADEE